MIVVAGLAVGFNVVLGLVLHGWCQIPHSHSHSLLDSEEGETTTGFQVS